MYLVFLDVFGAKFVSLVACIIEWNTAPVAIEQSSATFGSDYYSYCLMSGSVPLQYFKGAT